MAPRKVRVVARMTEGKRVFDVLHTLSFMPNKAALMLRKLIASAAANARQTAPGLQDTEIVVKSVSVDKGVTYRRFQPRAFGRASPLHRECSHVRVQLAAANHADTQIEVAEPAKKK